MKCSDCKYYRMIKDKNTWGFCYLNPPVVILKGDEFSTRRPVVAEQDFCRFWVVDSPEARKKAELGRYK